MAIKSTICVVLIIKLEVYFRQYFVCGGWGGNTHTDYLDNKEVDNNCCLFNGVIDELSRHMCSAIFMSSHLSWGTRLLSLIKDALKMQR